MLHFVQAYLTSSFSIYGIVCESVCVCVCVCLFVYLYVCVCVCVCDFCEYVSVSVPYRHIDLLVGAWAYYEIDPRRLLVRGFLNELLKLSGASSWDIVKSFIILHVKARVYH